MVGRSPTTHMFLQIAPWLDPLHELCKFHMWEQKDLRKIGRSSFFWMLRKIGRIFLLLTFAENWPQVVSIFCGELAAGYSIEFCGKLAAYYSIESCGKLAADGYFWVLRKNSRIFLRLSTFEAEDMDVSRLVYNYFDLVIITITNYFPKNSNHYNY